MRRLHPLVLPFALGWTFVYVDRAVLAPALGQIASDFGVSATALGLLLSTFYFTYTAFQLPVAFVAERWGRKRLLIWGFAGFGMTTVLAGFAPSFAVLLVLSALTGIAQATYYPTQYSIAVEALSGPRRTIQIAAINAGMGVGIGLGTILGAFLVAGSDLGWRFSLGFMGAATIVVAGFLAWRVKEPVRAESPTESLERHAGRGLFRRPQVAAYVANFASLYAFFLIVSWLPYYLVEFRGMAPTTAALVSTIPAWASIPASLLAAWWSDRASSQRVVAMAMFPVAAAAIALLPSTDSGWPLIAVLLLYGVTGKLAVDPLIVRYLGESTQPRQYSAAFGILNFAGMVGSIVAPGAAGVLLDVMGGMEAALYSASALLLLGTVALWLAHARVPEAQRDVVGKAEPLPVQRRDNQ